MMTSRGNYEFVGLPNSSQARRVRKKKGDRGRSGNIRGKSLGRGAKERGIFMGGVGGICD